MTYTKELEKLSRQYGKDVMEQILESASIIEIPENTELIREGVYVKAVPIVLEGMVKVYAGEDNKEILLYYIQPGETCIMSFSAGLKNDRSKVFAIAKETTTALLLPAENISSWLKEFPILNQLFYQQYDLRYSEMIKTLHHLLFDKLDKRIMYYLKEKAAVTGNNTIKISHKEIANDLATAREVVSRLIKKLENQLVVKQHHDSIEIL